MNNILPKGFFYEKVDSTMDEARRLLKSGQIEDTAFVVANCQTSGRGTRGKIWSSPEKAGIYLSLVHLPKEKKFLETTTLYTLACGVACVEAIKEITNIQTSLKPVNDIYANGKKLGGILVESELYKEGISSLITGVGINVNKTFHNLEKTEVLPVSLEELMGSYEFKKLENKKLIEKIVLKICFWYDLVFNGCENKIINACDSYNIGKLNKTDISSIKS